MIEPSQNLKRALTEHDLSLNRALREHRTRSLQVLIELSQGLNRALIEPDLSLNRALIEHRFSVEIEIASTILEMVTRYNFENCTARPFRELFRQNGTARTFRELYRAEPFRELNRALLARARAARSRSLRSRALSLSILLRIYLLYPSIYILM